MFGVLFILVIKSSLFADTLDGRVLYVTDGDTFILIDENNNLHTIRLKGIDAPELNQMYGDQSKKNLSKLIDSNFVQIYWNKRDIYGRIIGKVIFKGKDINLEQVKKGLAWHYKEYQSEQSIVDQKKYTEAEIKARKSKSGLWYDLSYIPPWEWRQRQ